mmetsp:Transcript_37436/g.85798  ORF Transcript_37436/g.85798 Transcript_37436/m.85798 type:complete len:205 (-) Transcript_37436:1-615(-)
MHEDWLIRWTRTIDPAVKRTLAIASLLHPMFKSYKYADGKSFVPPGEGEWATRELRTEWHTICTEWKPCKSSKEKKSEASAGSSSTDPIPLSEGTQPLTTADDAEAAPIDADKLAISYTKKRKVSLGSLFMSTVSHQSPVVISEDDKADELQQYLDAKEEAHFDIDLAAPASSAGVKRVFSAAGKMQHAWRFVDPKAAHEQLAV